MYAIVEIDSRQYKLAQNDQIWIERAFSGRRQKLTFDKVLLLVKDKKAQIGNPYLKGAKVNCEIIAQRKGKKKLTLKYRRRKNSQSKKGQRQKLIKVQVKEIKL